MSSAKHDLSGGPAVPGRAETSFRMAFDRLASGRPNLLPRGSKVSQNNVAREAKCDPSALKKDRFRELVEEIQEWIKVHADEAPKSPRQKALAQRKQNRDLEREIVKLTDQRDKAASKLVEADLKILELTIENARLSALQPASNVTAFEGRGREREK
jgi:hypothetical protein